MRLRIEPCDGEEEVVIYCHSETHQVQRIAHTVERLLAEDGELVLTFGETEFYVPKKEILFFETSGGKLTAHTVQKMYYVGSTLQALEQSLPHVFVRASKSCIVNASWVCALSKNITGMGEVLFKRSDKKVFVSRGYYRTLKQKIYELHELEPR